MNIQGLECVYRQFRDGLFEGEVLCSRRVEDKAGQVKG